jgi:hypothetical protein
LRNGVLTALFVSLTALIAGGCGTVSNLASSDPWVYGGLAHDPLFHPDENSILGPVGNMYPSHLPIESFGGGPAALVAVACILMLPPAFIVTDISLDLVGDTLTLPMAYYIEKKNRPSHCEAKSSPKQEPAPEPEPESPLVLPACLLENPCLQQSISQAYWAQLAVAVFTECEAPCVDYASPLSWRSMDLSESPAQAPTVPADVNDSITPQLPAFPKLP